TLSADLDPKESSLSTIVQTRDAFVGVEYDRYKISLGKMPNLQRNISDGVLDIFAQGTSPTSRHATRNSNTAKVNVRVTDNLNVVSAIVMDGKDGNKKLDSWELGNSYSLGAINIVSAYAKNENTGVRTIIGGATTTFKSVTVGGIYEQDKDTSTSVTTDTINLVAALKLGDQTLKGGFSTVERGDETYLAEVSHDFSTNASAYVGTKHTSGLEDASYTVGFRYSF
ncbi:MAG: hypothetical protein OR994_08110, partial [Candidatus Poseidoniales archaeon]|nr:hypothetical protein [Candidatus Poseidoniales archaeon]